MTDDWVPPPPGPPLPPPVRLDGLTLSFGEELELAFQVDDGLVNVWMKRDYPDDQPFDFDRLLVERGPWHVRLGTGAQNHFINLRVRVHAEQPASEAGWDDRDEVVLPEADAYLACESLYCDHYARWTLPSTGPWALRASCRGRDRSRTTDGTAFATEDREEWLLDLWPVSG